MAEIDPISSFSSNPLTTTFSRPDDCSGIQRSSFISGVDIATSCMPDGFEPDPSSFFSPGLICPDGYVSACHENTGVESITTVTCCPKVEDVTLSCVTAKTLQSVWTDYFCTWIGPEKETSMPITLSDNGKTSTEMVGYKSPGGLNAYGVRMVYQSSDLEEAEITAPPDNGEEDPEPVSDGDGGGLSTGAKAAIGVVVPVVVIAIAVAVFFFMRRRKKAAAAALAPAEADSKPPPVYGDAPMAHPQPPAELPIAQEPHPTELHAVSMGPAELPAESNPPGNAVPGRP